MKTSELSKGKLDQTGSMIHCSSTYVWHLQRMALASASIRTMQMLRMHLLENLRQRIEAGHADFVNELRVCTTVFCGLPSLQVC